MTPPEQYERARAAFTAALARLQGLHSYQGARSADPTVAQFVERAQAAAVEALLWVRAFDTAARGEEAGVPLLSGYLARRPTLIDAALYAANKGIHLLVGLTNSVSVSGPGPLGGASLGGGASYPILTWLTEAALPPLGTRDPSRRAEFVRQWCGRPVLLTLREVETVLAHR
ncbi:hypothetical protein [Actinokineospora terrae]|uniref:Uncharacterized protein n=1 Tax=Actinokineospora terrae TaxID=155974 RepID=A0A1H9XH88_9PSEU|nr:hypothetical protein [Actinokineospora terrae]SES45494.1 hypothetical protein SAMN04487818_11598 [Actinokineospora terrae]